MFALYNNAKNVVVEDNFGHLIKMLEIDGSQCFKRRSKLFMKMLVSVISIADGVA
jgi:hypothetical protein